MVIPSFMFVFKPKVIMMVSFERYYNPECKTWNKSQNSSFTAVYIGMASNVCKIQFHSYQLKKENIRYFMLIMLKTRKQST